MPRSGNQSDAAIPKYVRIPVHELKVLRGTQELTRQCHQLIYVVVGPVGRMYPTILGSLHQNRGAGEQVRITYVIPMSVGYCNTSDIASARFRRVDPPV